jgi:parvulin-like peptidyl-prolyl isomerase
MLKQFASDQQRLQFLNSYIVEEILYRRALDSKLMEDPAVRAQLRDAERNLLARQMMESEMSGKVFITDGDIALYYDARKANFVEPASAKLSHIVVADEESAKQVIERVLAGEEFAALAAELSTDAETKEKGGALATAAVQGEGIAGLGLPAGSLDPLFAAKPGDILDVPVQSEAGFHVFQVNEQTPARQKSLEEVKSQIYAEMHRQKEREVQAKLLEDLRDEYDVVIHQDAFKGAAPKE